MGFVNSAATFAEDAMLLVNFSGGTTQGSVIIGSTDISLAYSNDNVEIQAIEDNFNKSYISTSSSWTVSASFGLRNLTGTTAIDTARWSGDTKILSVSNRTKTGLELLEFAKTKNLTVTLILKLKAGNYQVGKAIITSMNIDFSVGSPGTGSIEFQGTGALTKTP